MCPKAIINVSKSLKVSKKLKPRLKLDSQAGHDNNREEAILKF